MYTYTPDIGENIEATAKQMVAIAQDLNDQVTAIFNGVQLTAYSTTDPVSIVKFFHDECERQSDEYKATPEYKERERKAGEEKKARAEKLAAALEETPRMSLKNPEKWEECVANNQDPYGSCVVRYAEKWARVMQGRMAKGETIAQCAQAASHLADDEGITGFMYGCAVSMLAVCWLHGEDLRKWHNLEYQIKDEGEKANAKEGAVLNPAMLSVG